MMTRKMRFFMEISIVNQTEDQQWDMFEQDFLKISEKTTNVLKLDKNYS